MIHSRYELHIFLVVYLILRQYDTEHFMRLVLTNFIVILTS